MSRSPSCAAILTHRNAEFRRRSKIAKQQNLRLYFVTPIFAGYVFGYEYPFSFAARRAFGLSRADWLMNGSSETAPMDGAVDDAEGHIEILRLKFKNYCR
jgi:hypothetical protein